MIKIRRGGKRKPLQFKIPEANQQKQGIIANKPMHDSLKEALGQKGKPLNYVKAASGTNPLYSEEHEGYSINCQRCAVAYELRRRGYDVVAQPAPNGDKWKEYITINGVDYDYWRGAFRNAKTERVGSQRAKGVIENIEKKMKEYGPGSRAVIAIEYKGPGHSGHVFNVENINGKIYYIEAQHKTYGGSNIYTKADVFDLLLLTKTQKVSLTRTDNLRISDRAKYFVTPRKEDE